MIKNEITAMDLKPVMMFNLCRRYVCKYIVYQEGTLHGISKNNSKTLQVNKATWCFAFYTSTVAAHDHVIKKDVGCCI